MPEFISKIIARIIIFFVDYAQLNDKSEDDKNHDVAIGIFEAIHGILRRIFPKGWKFCLFVYLGDRELRYWTGTMTEAEFQDCLITRLEKHTSEAVILKEMARLKGLDAR